MRSAEEGLPATHAVSGALAVTAPASCTDAAFEHEGLAVACARRFVGRGVAMEDLLQEARAALCQAQERFDANRGIRFATYAVPVVLGALRACCRQATPMHVPRREGDQLRSLLGMPAREHNPPQPQQSRQQSIMLAAYQRMQTLTTDPELAALAREDSFEERVLLREAIRQLGEPYGKVIGLRYFCGLSQRQVGQRLHAEQWQVCRWEKTGLDRLREGWQ